MLLVLWLMLWPLWTGPDGKQLSKVPFKSVHGLLIHTWTGCLERGVQRRGELSVRIVPMMVMMVPLIE